MTAALVSIISRVIKSQQFFLYNSITFISISITSIPVPATHIPTTNIFQHMMPVHHSPAIQTFIGWTIAAGHSAAQISTKIPNAFIAGIIYWLLLILVVGICVAGTGILVILIEIKVIELYKKNCWDFITLLMILTSAAVIIYFGESIKKTLSVNLLLLFVLSQGVYVGLRCYLKNQLNTKLY